MQIWHIYHEGEIDKALLMLSKSKIKLAIVVTTKNGERIATASYDAAATQLKNGEIHALLKIDRIFYEKELYFELDFKQLYPEDIKEMAICDQWVSESESPESVLKPGQKVFHAVRTGNPPGQVQASFRGRPRILQAGRSGHASHFETCAVLLPVHPAEQRSP